jgi:hypothetical protein
MPRLVGKQSNSGIYAFLCLLGFIAVIVALEYFGVINLVEDFGSATNLFDSAY